MLCNIVNMNSVPSAPQNAHVHCGQSGIDAVRVLTCLFLLYNDYGCYDYELNQNLFKVLC